MQSKRWMILIQVQNKLINIWLIEVYASTTVAEETELVYFYDNLQNLKQKKIFHIYFKSLKY